MQKEIFMNSITIKFGADKSNYEYISQLEKSLLETLGIALENPDTPLDPLIAADIVSFCKKLHCLLDGEIKQNENGNS